MLHAPRKVRLGSEFLGSKKSRNKHRCLAPSSTFTPVEINAVVVGDQKQRQPQERHDCFDMRVPQEAEINQERLLVRRNGNQESTRPRQPQEPRTSARDDVVVVPPRVFSTVGLLYGSRKQLIFLPSAVCECFYQHSRSDESFAWALRRTRKAKLPRSLATATIFSQQEKLITGLHSCQHNHHSKHVPFKCVYGCLVGWCVCGGSIYSQG